MGYIGNQPAETPVVEILETDFKIGEDDQTKIDFADANNINFHADNAKEMVLSANALTPGTSDGTALGTTSLMWSDLFLASGGVMNFNNGNVTMTHSADTLTVVGATVAFTASTAVTVSNDLKLASDSAVLGFGADNDTTLTHTDGTGLTLNSTNKLTFGDAASFVQQSSDGVLRIDGEATVDINASTAVTISNDLKLDSDAAVLSFGADSEASITHADDAGLTFNSDITTTSHKYIKLPENSSIKFTDQIGVDNSIDNDDSQGIIFTFRTGATVTPFSPVYLDNNNEVQEADADAIATMPCIGVSINTSNVTADNDIEVMLLGLIRHDSFTDFGAAGAPVFVSTTVGTMTTTAPSGTDDVVQIVGHSIAEDLLFVQPSLTFITHE
tara:strand:+ start:41 stop:1198 length:1158 start_codon:yes stop_codon:yes gene_type:complete